MKLKTFLAILLILVFIGFGYHQFNLSSKKTNPDQTSKKKETSLNIKEKKQLDEMILNLEGYDICPLIDNYTYENGCLYQKDQVQIEDLNFSYKLYSFILNHLDNFELEEKEIEINQKKYLVEGNISEAVIKEDYQKTYGTSEVFDSRVINEFQEKSKIIFDENNKLFYLKKKKQNRHITKKYIFNYEKNDQEIYVDVSVAFIQLIGKNEYTNYEAYHEKEKINLKEEGLYKELDSFKISSDNYQEYTQYRYTFSKDSSGRYQFLKLNIIK